jgi:hypothetical protein
MQNSKTNITYSKGRRDHEAFSIHPVRLKVFCDPPSSSYCSSNLLLLGNENLIAIDVIRVAVMTPVRILPREYNIGRQECRRNPPCPPPPKILISISTTNPT